jgi:probable HAF family extracellular repeat protein
MTPRSLRVLRTMTLALTLAAAGPLLAAPRYTITELPASQPGGSSVGYRINSSGTVLGLDSGQAALFAGGGVTDLSPLAGPSGLVRGLNDAGYVVGYGLNAGGQVRAFQTGAEGLIPLPSLGYRIDAPVDMNNAGVAAGSMITLQGHEHAAIWTSDSVLDFGVMPGQRDARAVAINNLGQVAGNSGPRGFTWTDAGGFVDIGTLGGATTVTDINDNGWVTGLSELVPGGATSAFIYNGATMSAFGPIGKVTPFLSTQPWAINRDGVAVGVSQRDDRFFTAFVYRDGETMELQTLIDPALGWELRAAYDINEAGQITGAGYLNGRQSAFILTPIKTTAAVPEPGVWALMILGFGAVGVRLRRRRRRRVAV